ncbi:hypothetical protein T4B_6726 [Trichinella pseudospiralis]|uniref:Uncharacterized protein n=2 Tax=Trichinella pseudospiralis TaxID=6337 RepID=A0A0V1FZQ1_TRIPS|nr:hypothetical protein T4D_13489 [Trichinella pseudospiralis]KRZ33697.1 hypothetical protein T4B_6726 [Trichinella pseudospiralis]
MQCFKKRVNEQKQKNSGNLTNHGGKKMGLYVFCKHTILIRLFLKALRYSEEIIKESNKKLQVIHVTLLDMI